MPTSRSRQDVGLCYSRLVSCLRAVMRCGKALAALLTQCLALIAADTGGKHNAGSLHHGCRLSNLTAGMSVWHSHAAAYLATRMLAFGPGEVSCICFVMAPAGFAPARSQQGGQGRSWRRQHSTRQTLRAAWHAAQGSDVGMVLSLDAVDWQQRLAADLAARLAAASFVVVARTTKQSAETVHAAAARFEKVLDACATSPYSRNAKRWILAGGSSFLHSDCGGWCADADHRSCCVMPPRLMQPVFAQALATRERLPLSPADVAEEPLLALRSLASHWRCASAA